MEFIDRTFTDKDVTLDGNDFINCIFDGCVIRYNGGTCSFTGGFIFRNGGNIRFGPGVDPVNNGISQFLIQGTEAQGWKRLTDDEVAAQVPTPPKKDLG